jgi:uncharacterized protein YjbI with pentapeptide repeats/heme/copper-type cytochrome/quinol oxidase subunit 4
VKPPFWEVFFYFYFKNKKIFVRMNVLNKNWKIISLIAFVIIIIIICFYEVIANYFFMNDTSQNPNGELLKFIFQILGGIILISGAYYSLQIAKASQENNKLVEKGNIAERFKNAINMLDSKESTICLGGIHAMNNIAQENEEYRSQVFDVLIAFISDRTKFIKSWYELTFEERLINQPSIEIITILRILFSSNSIFKNFDARFENVKLYGANLRNYNFSRCHFKNVEFQNCDLRNSLFIKCNFFNSDFTLCDLNSVDFTESKFWDNTALCCCGMYFTNFTGCYIQNVRFSFSSMFDVRFDGAVLNQTSFNGVGIQITPPIEGFKDNSGSFLGANFGQLYYKGLFIKGYGLIARGLLFNGGVYVTGFLQNIREIVNKNAEINFINEIDEVSKQEIDEYSKLFDINSENIIFRHTINTILKDPNYKPTGWVFSDTRKFTIHDYELILDRYNRSLEKI